MKRLLFVPVILMFHIACGNLTSSQPAASSAEATTAVPDGWKVYEDDWFRVYYPEGSDVGGGPDGKQNPAFPVLGVVPKTAGDGVFGMFTLQFDTRTKGMLLRDAIQTEISASMKERGSLLSQPREVKVGRGKCLTAVASWPFNNCPEGEGNCYSASVLTVCDDQAGRRYVSNSLLSRGKEPNALSPQAKQEAAVYERILRSLEFKKS